MTLNPAKPNPSEPTPARPSEATPQPEPTQSSAPTPTAAETPTVEATLTETQSCVAPNGADSNAGAKDQIPKTDLGPKSSSFELHVSPSGKEGASGSATDPLPSLIEAVKALKALPSERKSEGVTILLSGGTHFLPEGVVFDASCSGTSNAPTTIAPEPGANPILTAGRSVSDAQLESVTDPSLLDRLDPEARPHVRQVDLAKLGIPPLTPLPAVFLGNWRPLQVTSGTNDLPISRWPNGEYGFTTMKSVTDNGNSTHGGTFVYREDRPLRWQKAPGR